MPDEAVHSGVSSECRHFARHDSDVVRVRPFAFHCSARVDL